MQCQRPGCENEAPLNKAGLPQSYCSKRCSTMAYRKRGARIAYAKTTKSIRFYLCPSCGKRYGRKSKGDVVFCPYCGTYWE